MSGKKLCIINMKYSVSNERFPLMPHIRCISTPCYHISRQSLKQTHFYLFNRIFVKNTMQYITYCTILYKTLFILLGTVSIENVVYEQKIETISTHLMRLLSILYSLI